METHDVGTSLVINMRVFYNVRTIFAIKMSYLKAKDTLHDNVNSCETETGSLIPFSGTVFT